jgi:hypothetical protein
MDCRPFASATEISHYQGSATSGSCKLAIGAYGSCHVRWTENRNMGEFLRLLAQGQVQLQPLITHEFPLDDASSAYRTIMDPASNSLAVLLRYAAANSAGVFEPKRRVDLPTPAVPASSERGAALVGAGGLARWAHLPNLKKIPHVTFRAIHSASGARGKSYAIRFGATCCATDYEETLRDPQSGLALITSRNQHHAAQAFGALRAGKHVFVEKPMAITEQECREINSAVQESGKQLTVGFNRRFAPFYRGLKKHMARRSDRPCCICRMNSPGISGAYWMADPTIGGAILGEACHFIDLMYWLLDSEPMAVTAFALPTSRKDPIGENNLVASFRFADGSIGNLTYCTVGSTPPVVNASRLMRRAWE